MVNLTEILISSVSSTVLVGIAAFLARNWISERLKQGIKHEYDLKLKEVENKYDREQISLKANFDKEISIYQYKLEQVHPKRIQLIEKLNMDIDDINREIEINLDLLDLINGGLITADCSKVGELDIKEKEFCRFAKMAEFYLTPKLNGSLRIIKKQFSSIILQMVHKDFVSEKFNKSIKDIRIDWDSSQIEIDNFFNLSKDVINENAN